MHDGATRGPGSRSSSAGAAPTARSRAGTLRADRRAGRRRRRSARRRRAARRVSRGAVAFETLHALTAAAGAQRDRALHLGRRRVLPAARARRARRCVGTPADARAWRRATCSCSRSVRGPDGQDRATPTRRTATPSGSCADAVDRDRPDAGRRRRARRGRVARGRRAAVRAALASTSGGRAGRRGARQRRARRPRRDDARRAEDVAPEELGAPGGRPRFRPRLDRSRADPRRSRTTPRRGRAAPAAAALRVDPRDALPALAAVRRGRALGAAARPARQRPLRRRLRRRDGGGRHAPTLRFGDGLPRPRADRGRRRSRPRYRIGIGRPGNVGAGALDASWSTPARHRAVPQPAAGRRRRRPGAARAGAPLRAAGVPHARSAPSPPPTTRRSPSATPRCSRRPPRAAGPAAGTRCSSPSTASAARPVDAAFEDELRAFLDRFRLAGHDLEIDGAALRRARARRCRSAWRPATCAATSERRCSTRSRSRPAARLLPSRPLHVRPAGLPERDRRRRDGGARRRVGRRHATSSALRASRRGRARERPSSTSARLEIARLDNDPQPARERPASSSSWRAACERAARRRPRHLRLRAARRAAEPRDPQPARAAGARLPDRHARRRFLRRMLRRDPARGALGADQRDAPARAR